MSSSDGASHEGLRVRPTHVIAKEAFRREQIILGEQIVVLSKR